MLVFIFPERATENSSENGDGWWTATVGDLLSPLSYSLPSSNELHRMNLKLLIWWYIVHMLNQFGNSCDKEYSEYWCCLKLREAEFLEVSSNCWGCHLKHHPFAVMLCAVMKRMDFCHISIKRDGHPSLNRHSILLGERIDIYIYIYIHILYHVLTLALVF